MREKRPILSFRGREDLSYCIRSGRVSSMLVSGKTFSITKVLSDDIDDIKDPKHHMRRRTFFELVCGFAEPWMALRARNPSPSGRATLNPQSKCHGPRPGPKTCVRGPGGLPACHGAESTRKDPRPEEKKMLKVQKNTFIYLYKVPLRDVCEAKSRR